MLSATEAAGAGQVTTKLMHLLKYLEPINKT